MMNAERIVRKSNQRNIRKIGVRGKSLTDCQYNLDFKETGFAELYASDIEYYVLTLEALLQDMAI
jgi:hypothetical protein